MSEIKKAFQKLEPKVAKKVVRKALRKGMKLVLADAMTRVPKGETGDLKRSIKIKARKRSRKVIAINLVIGKGDFQGPTYYGAMVEFGTKKQPAQHFLESAYKATSDHAGRVIKDAIRDGILEQASKK